MSDLSKILIADPVREKQRIWSQTKITKFAKRMKAPLTLRAESCCDAYHQDKRRNGTEARKHPKRVLRIFIYYVVYISHIKYDDDVGSAILIHDVGEDVSMKILIGAEWKYGFKVIHYAVTVSKDDHETMAEFHDRILSTDKTVMMKLSDCLDNLLGMLDEYYQGMESATEDRLIKYLNLKIKPFVNKVKKISFVGSVYEKAIHEALHDLQLVCEEAEDALRGA